MKESLHRLTCIAGLALVLGSQGLFANDSPPVNDSTETEGVAEAEAAADASAVMSQPLNAGSSDELKASIAKVKAEATPEEWRMFNNAYGKIRSFDLAARNNPQVLMERVNGQTPLQVIDYANERWN